MYTYKQIVGLVAVLITVLSLASLRGLKGRDKLVYVVEFFTRIFASSFMRDLIG